MRIHLLYCLNAVYLYIEHYCIMKGNRLNSYRFSNFLSNTLRRRCFSFFFQDANRGNGFEEVSPCASRSAFFESHSLLFLCKFQVVVYMCFVSLFVSVPFLLRHPNWTIYLDRKCYQKSAFPRGGMPGELARHERFRFRPPDPSSRMGNQ